MKLSLKAGTSPFAHLLGRGKAASKADNDMSEDEDADAKKAKGKKAKADADDMNTDENETEKKDELADDVEDDLTEEQDSALDEGEEAEPKDKIEAKKAKKAKADGDDGSDEDDEADAKASAIRRRERARCAAIFACPAAARRPDMAAYLAFATSMARTAAVNTLKAIAQGEQALERDTKPQGLNGRMATRTNPTVGSGGGERRTPEADPAKAMAAAIIAAGAKARGEKPAA